METLEKFEKEATTIDGKLKTLTIEKDKALKKLAELTTRIQSEQEKEKIVNDYLRKTLDEERLIKDSINVVRSLSKKYGLTDQDFKSMLSLVERIGLLGMPGQTMDNVKSLIEKYQTLEKIETTIVGHREALEKLHLEIDKAEGRLHTSITAFTDAVNQIQQQTTTVLTKTGDAELAEMKQLRIESESGLKTLSQKAEESLNNIQSTSSGIVTALKAQSKTTLNRFDRHIADTLKKFSATEIALLKDHRKKITETYEQGQIELHNSLDDVKNATTSIHNAILEVRDDATKTGEMIGKMKVFEQINNLLKGEGTQNEIFVTMDLLCHRFKYWIENQSPPVDESLHSRLVSFIESLEEPKKG